MLSILTPEPATMGMSLKSSPDAPRSHASPQDGGAKDASPEEAQDLEIVLGRRQVASLSFLACSVLVICCGGTYLMGKASAGAPAALPVAPAALASPLAAAPRGAPLTTPFATASFAPIPIAAATPASPVPSVRDNKAGGGMDAILKSSPPIPADDSVLFGEPVSGALYIQVSALERGPSVILASALVTRGFHAIITPGLSGMFRTLVGPFKSAADYQLAKDVLDRLGLPVFARTYGQ